MGKYNNLSCIKIYNSNPLNNICFNLLLLIKNHYIFSLIFESVQRLAEIEMLSGCPIKAACWFLSDDNIKVSLIFIYLCNIDRLV